VNGFRAGPTPLVIAHRGASAFAPENTLAAFRLAVEQGAGAVELDAKLSADGQVIVLHDTTLDRTTNGHGPVRNFSVQQLKKLDAGSFFSADFGGEPLPTLEEVFDAVGRSIFINVELTNYDSPNDRLVEKCVDLVSSFHLEERVLFSSFHPLNLMRARSLLPEVPVAILALPGRPGWWARSFLIRKISPEAVNPYYSDVSSNFTAHQHQIGRRVNVWTVNDPKDLERMVLIGVDGIITDNPPAALRVIFSPG
jgi:glycerophosphoryl diester phosphodiesterase